jgi:hypothetical protein
LEDHFIKERAKLAMSYDLTWVRKKAAKLINEDVFDREVYNLENDHKITREKGLELRS